MVNNRQINVNENILLRVYTRSGRENRHRSPEESCCQCRTLQNVVSVPPQSNNPVQKHERIVGSGNSSHSLSAQTMQTTPYS